MPRSLGIAFAVVENLQGIGVVPSENAQLLTPRCWVCRHPTVTLKAAGRRLNGTIRIERHPTKLRLAEVRTNLTASQPCVALCAAVTSNDAAGTECNSLPRPERH